MLLLFIVGGLGEGEYMLTLVLSRCVSGSGEEVQVAREGGWKRDNNGVRHRVAKG